MTGTKSGFFKHGDVKVDNDDDDGVQNFIKILTINDDSAQFSIELLFYIHSIPRERNINAQNMAVCVPVKQFYMHITGS